MVRGVAHTKRPLRYLLVDYLGFREEILPLMALKTETVLVDDIDGQSLALDTIRFGLDGASYEIDLNPRNAALLRAVFRGYIEKARRLERSSL